jgi:hypothetical protein
MFGLQSAALAVSAVSEVSGFLSLFPTRAQAGFVIGDGGVE